jgi:hypothetical protein
MDGIWVDLGPPLRWHFLWAMFLLFYLLPLLSLDFEFFLMTSLYVCA